MNNNTDTISIIGRTELEDVKVYSDEKLTLRRVFIMSREIIMSANNINVCRTEGHENIVHGVDENQPLNNDFFI